MKRRQLGSRPARLRFLGALVILIVSTGCGDGPLGIISTEREVEFGREAHLQLTSEMYEICHECDDVILDESSGLSLTDYVDGLGRHVATVGNPDRGAERRQIPEWNFTILADDEINAFALPGGFIYVTTGLLEVMTNKAELAAILGHEVAHVTKYHGVKRLEQYMIVQGLGSLIFGDSSSLAEAAAGFILTVDNLVSSKDAEREADQYGVRYSYETGWNSLEMNNFFRHIEPLYGKEGGLSNVLASHPHPSERIRNVNAHAQALGITADSPDLKIDHETIPYERVREAAQAINSAHPAQEPVARGPMPARIQVMMCSCHNP